jgi:ankyrin repeat protein
MQCPIDLKSDALHHSFDFNTNKFYQMGAKCSALGIAILNDMRLVAERLIELGADVNEWDSLDGSNLTHVSNDMLALAARGNGAGYITLLVENGASVDLPADAKHISAIQWASMYGGDVAAQELCDLGANMNYTSKYSYPHLALKVA